MGPTIDGPRSVTGSWITQPRTGPSLAGGPAGARLSHKQGEVAGTRELLQGIHRWFTDGSDTVDLKEAKRLLEALA